MNNRLTPESEASANISQNQVYNNLSKTSKDSFGLHSNEYYKPQSTAATALLNNKVSHERSTP